MAVVQLGNNSSTEFLLYEDSPIFVSEDNLFKIQGSLDVRSLVGTVEGGGLVLEAKVFSGIPNLEFHIDEKKQKAVRSSL